jgi:hypothetical protein
VRLKIFFKRERGCCIDTDSWGKVLKLAKKMEGRYAACGCFPGLGACGIHDQGSKDAKVRGVCFLALFLAVNTFGRCTRCRLRVHVPDTPIESGDHYESDSCSSSNFRMGGYSSETHEGRGPSRQGVGFRLTSIGNVNATGRPPRIAGLNRSCCTALMALPSRPMPIGRATYTFCGIPCSSTVR